MEVVKMISKKEMTEEDIKMKYINPALEKSQWNVEDILFERYFTDGRIEVRGNKAKRKNGKKADYLLHYKKNYPIAVIEAKDNKHSPEAGIQQALDYAAILDVPFAYSTNGDMFVEHDRILSKERTFPMSEFPTKEQLWERIIATKELTEEQLQVIQQPYHYTRGAKSPRYYQRIAINKTVEAIANGQRRIMLVMATGTGKTFTAFQIVYRLMKAGTKKRVLYLADRNILVDQAMTEDFSPLSEISTKVTDRKLESAYEIHFALYQQLAGNEDGKEPFRQFSKDFFDLVVIDEAHRGSANEESNWRKIIDYFDGPNTTHIGMTATPKNDKEASNLDYFGEPVYTYSLKQGIEDGFLAPYRVIRVGLDVDLEGYRPEKGKTDIYGELIPDREYGSNDFDKNLIIDDRTVAVAKYITRYLKDQDRRYDKTIIFCIDINHAARMRQALINENSDLYKLDDRYVLQITGDNQIGKSQLGNFADSNSKYPTLVTTSKLLTTGVNIKTCKLIVLDSNINSMTEFKQIIGRGTRLDEEHDKEFFTIMDFRNVTRHFADPDFDGEPIITKIIDGTDTEPEPGVFGGDNEDDTIDGSEGGTFISDPPTGDGSEKKRHVYHISDRRVKVLNDRVQFMDAKGKLITESIRDYSKKNILDQYATLDHFLNAWNHAERKRVLLEEMEARGVFLEELQKEEQLEEFDEFDLILHLAYDQKPLTKTERINNVKKSGYLNQYQEVAREVLEELLDKYKDDGIGELDDTQVLELKEFDKYGGVVNIIFKFGGIEGYKKALNGMKEKLYTK